VPHVCPVFREARCNNVSLYMHNVKANRHNVQVGRLLHAHMRTCELMQQGPGVAKLKAKPLD
jgi:hypothetical protein